MVDVQIVDLNKDDLPPYYVAAQIHVGEQQLTLGVTLKGDQPVLIDEQLQHAWTGSWDALLGEVAENIQLAAVAEGDGNGDRD